MYKYRYIYIYIYIQYADILYRNIKNKNFL